MSENKATYRYITDPGHGWLEVPRQLLRELDIEYDITVFSYVDKGRAYLEEDRDMPAFINAFKVQLSDVELVIDEISLDHDAFVRNLRPYPMTRPQVDASEPATA